MTDTDRRRTGRVQILGDLPGAIMAFNPLSVSQISRLGAEIETSFSLPLGSVHELRLTLGDQSVVVKARVAHSSVGDVDQDRVIYRSGIEFVDVPGAIETAIAEFVDALTTARTRPGD